MTNKVTIVGAALFDAVVRFILVIVVVVTVTNTIKYVADRHFDERRYEYQNLRLENKFCTEQAWNAGAC